MAETAAPIEKMSFEAALEELQKIVSDLESGKTTLEKSITAYERGVALKSHCEARLRDAQSKIEKIVVAADGSLSTTALDKD